MPATLFAEPRAAVVPLTFDVDADGAEVWHWEKSVNGLFLQSPGMPLGTEGAKWHERTYIAARYLIYADQPAEGEIEE